MANNNLQAWFNAGKWDGGRDVIKSLMCPYVALVLNHLKVSLVSWLKWWSSILLGRFIMRNGGRLGVKDKQKNLIVISIAPNRMSYLDLISIASAEMLDTESLKNTKILWVLLILYLQRFLFWWVSFVYFLWVWAYIFGILASILFSHQNLRIFLSGTCWTFSKRPWVSFIRDLFLTREQYNRSLVMVLEFSWSSPLSLNHKS